MKKEINLENLKLMGFIGIRKDFYGNWVMDRKWWPAGRPSKDRNEYDKVYSTVVASESHGSGTLKFCWSYENENYHLSVSKAVALWSGYDLSNGEKVGHLTNDPNDFENIWIAKDLKEIRKYHKEQE